MVNEQIHYHTEQGLNSDPLLYFIILRKCSTVITLPHMGHPTQQVDPY